MEETLKLLQLMQRLLVVAATTIVAVALSTTPQPQVYQSAYAQHSQVYETYEDIRDVYREELLNYYEGQGLIELIEDAFGKKIRENPEFQLSAGVDLAGMTPYELPLPHVQIDNFYGQIGQQLDKLPVYPVEVELFRPQIEEIIAENPGAEEILGVSVGFFNKNSMAPDKADYNMLGGGVSLYIRDVEGKSMWKSGGTLATLGPVQSELVEVARARELLYERGLITKIDGKESILPGLLPIWDEVVGKRPEIASAYLRLKASQEKLNRGDQVKIAGVEFKSATAFLLAPAILIAILIYMLAHLRHVERNSLENIDEIRNFPWLGVYTDLLSKILYLVTLFPLPAIAIACILYATDIATAWKAVLGVLYGLLICYVSMRISASSSRVRANLERAV